MEPIKVGRFELVPFSDDRAYKIIVDGHMSGSMYLSLNKSFWFTGENLIPSLHYVRLGDELSSSVDRLVSLLPDSGSLALQHMTEVDKEISALLHTLYDKVDSYDSKLCSHEYREELLLAIDQAAHSLTDPPVVWQDAE